MRKVERPEMRLPVMRVKRAHKGIGHGESPGFAAFHLHLDAGWLEAEFVFMGHDVDAAIWAL